MPAVSEALTGPRLGGKVSPFKLPKTLASLQHSFGLNSESTPATDRNDQVGTTTDRSCSAGPGHRGAFGKARYIAAIFTPRVRCPSLCIYKTASSGLALDAVNPFGHKDRKVPITDCAVPRPRLSV